MLLPRLLESNFALYFSLPSTSYLLTGETKLMSAKVHVKLVTCLSFAVIILNLKLCTAKNNIFISPVDIDT